MTPHQTTTGHKHPGQEEVYYFVKGTGIMYIDTVPRDVGPGDIVLIEDGVYGALKNTIMETTIIDAQKNCKIYVLGPDLKARVLDKNSLITNIEIVDYNKFVKLAVENDKIQNWL